MKIEIIMPKMGESINEGTLIKWHKKAGDSVKKDEIIYEISTDKVDTEIPSPDNGILVDIKVNEQETVEVGTVVAIIETESMNVELIKQEKSKVEIIEKKEIFTSSTEQIGGEIIEIPMPKMGESIMEGTIIKWHKKVGDSVKKDEIIFEISTDKVDTEVPSPSEGIIAEILYNENEVVGVGITVAKISTTTGFVRKEIVKEDVLNNINEVTKEELSPKIEKSNISTVEDKSLGFLSPLVLNIASKEGVSLEELKNINGTGINGRITKNDILNYLKNRSVKDTKLGKQEDYVSVPAAQNNKIVKTSSDKEIIPMNNIRQKIMKHMVLSRDTSVHVSAVIEVDMYNIYNYIQKNKDIVFEKEGVKLTYLSFIAYAVIKALREFPLVNSSIVDNDIIIKKFINLGIAVAVEPNGLIVPNIKNADEKNVKGLAKSINDLSYKARNKGLVPDDIMDGTFTITNYGVFGSLFGTPIINQPEVAILGVGAITKKPVVVEVNGMDTIAIKPMMYLSLSHDHRLIDGMLGGKFLKYIKDTLENFDTNIV